MSDVKPIPEGFPTVTTSLIVPKATEALDFYQRAFGAVPGIRMPGPDGESTMHAQMRIGDSTVMLSDENPQWGTKAPAALGGSPVSLHLYVEDVDALYTRAVEAGCEVVYPLENAFWGDRYAKLADPWGHQWGIATHIEDVEPEEMTRRAEEWFAAQAAH
jgi:PhnB protein